MTRKKIWQSGDSLPSFTNHLNAGDVQTLTPSLVSDYIQLSFAMTGGGNQYLYVDLSSITDYVIQTGDYLEYDIYWKTAGAIKIAMDFTLSDGNEFRDSGTIDQNGLLVHPSTDISARCSGVWYHRKMPFTTFTNGSSVGKTVQLYDVACEYDTSGTVIGRIRNIAITDGNGLSQSFNQTATEVVSFSDTLLKSISRILTENPTFTDTLIKGVTRNLSEVATFTETFLRSIGKNLVETITFTETFTKAISRTFTETVTFVETISKGINRTLTETVTFLDSLGDFILNSISAGIPSLGGFIRSILDLKPNGTTREQNKPGGIIRDDKPSRR